MRPKAVPTARVALTAALHTRRSTEDILKVRDPTRTIETLDFQYGKARFRVLDVGGQRMERPKWNLTGEITAVIFVCALTEYNQVLREDIKQNRLKESINLFDIACNRKYPDKPILLFLNKKDLFEQKIKETDLKVCYPAYKGGCDYDAALEFIKQKFLNTRWDKTRPIYIKETVATDTKNMEFIIKVSHARPCHLVTPPLLEDGFLVKCGLAHRATCPCTVAPS